MLLEPIDVTKYDYVRLDRQDTWGLLVRDDHPLAKKASLTAGGRSLLSAARCR